MRLLETKQLTIRFGGLTAVDHVDLVVNKGEIVGLIGPNGSGKTTIFNMVTGIYTPTEGEILFGGQPIHGAKPFVITNRGISRTFQNIRLFPNLSVMENVLIGCHCRMKQHFFDDLLATKKFFREESQARRTAIELLDVFGLLGLKDAMAKNLPYGLQRKLEIVRALASKPQLLLLDEPAAGMNPQETLALMALIRQVRDRGVTILLVEHDMKVVMGICERIVVLNYGRKIAEGTAAEIQNNEEVIQAYLGRQAKTGA
ncbi:MAG: ABC transporter ATP-binding protein [Bacillota bacterium]